MPRKTSCSSLVRTKSKSRSPAFSSSFSEILSEFGLHNAVSWLQTLSGLRRLTSSIAVADALSDAGTALSLEISCLSDINQHLDKSNIRKATAIRNIRAVRLDEESEC